MASTKKNTKKQDEKHLKILRELCSLPHNKKCFDCGQRGPTYVNMTIGSFVCTSCSGILRGLNPQHRVKSISMTSFTPTEIEFLQNAGNEVCRRSWLGLWNSTNPPEPESRDEHKVKDFMMRKYDRKAWYIPPSQLPPTVPKTESSNNLPERKPLKHLLGDNPPAVVSQEAPTSPTRSVAVPQPAKPAQHKPPVTDLLGDLGGDPFAQPAAPAGFNAFGSQPQVGASSFDAFGGQQPPQQPAQQQQQQQQHQQQQQFGGFNAFSSSPQQQSSNFNAFGGQDQQSQGFNAFASQNPPQQAAAPQQQTAAFNAFGTSPPRQQPAGGFGAFGNTQQPQAQQPASKPASFGSFSGQQPAALAGAPASSGFDAFDNFNSSAASQQTKTTTALGGFGPMVSASAGGAPTVPSGSVSAGDKYAALSDLDSIFKTPAPSASQGPLFGTSTQSNTAGFGMSSGMSTNVSSGMSGSSSMSSGPNPFASTGSTGSQMQSNPFQVSAGAGVNQSNGPAASAFGVGSSSIPSSSQNLNFAGAGMSGMAANQFSKVGGSQAGLFGSSPSGMQSSGFATGQGQFGQSTMSSQPAVGQGQFGQSAMSSQSATGQGQFGQSAMSSQPATGQGQFGQSTGGHFGMAGQQAGGGQYSAGSQFGSAQFGGAQFTASSQFMGGQMAGGPQTAGGQFSGGQPGAGQYGMSSQQQQQQQQQQSFGGMPSMQPNANQFNQTSQQQQFQSGWQRPQSNPFMGGGGAPAQRQSTNPFM